MKFTITCFKRRSDKSGDSFLHSYNGKKSEWELLKEDESLKSIGCDIQLIEYDDIRGLENGYDKKVDRGLYIDVRHENDFKASVPYRAQLFATYVAAFTMQFAKKFSVEMSPVVEESQTVVTKNAETQAPTTPVETFTTSWKLPVTIVSAVLFISLIVGGIVLYDWRRRKGSTLLQMRPFFLSEVPAIQPPVDFSKLRLKAKKEKEEEEGTL